MRGGIPVAGDFNGDGTSDVGVFKDGHWFIDLNGNGVWDDGDLWAKLGHRGDLPVTGDWDGDGKTDIGIYGPAWQRRPARHRPRAGPARSAQRKHRACTRTSRDRRIAPRSANARLKLTASGKTARRPDRSRVPLRHARRSSDRRRLERRRHRHDRRVPRRRWHRDIDGDGKWTKSDVKHSFGRPGDVPVVGDFNGDGIDELGVYRDGMWYIDTNGNGEIDAEDQVFELGGPGDKPVVGDWNGDGKVRRRRVSRFGRDRHANAPNRGKVIVGGNEASSAGSRRAGYLSFCSSLSVAAMSCSKRRTSSGSSICLRAPESCCCKTSAGDDAGRLASSWLFCPSNTVARRRAWFASIAQLARSAPRASLRQVDVAQSLLERPHDRERLDGLDFETLGHQRRGGVLVGVVEHSGQFGQSTRQIRMTGNLPREGRGPATRLAGLHVETFGNHSRAAPPRRPSSTWAAMCRRASLKASPRVRSAPRRGRQGQHRRRGGGFQIEARRIGRRQVGINDLAGGRVGRRAVPTAAAGSTASR